MPRRSAAAHPRRGDARRADPRQDRRRPTGSAHLGRSPSLFVNAATWGLLLTGKLVATHSERGPRAARSRGSSRKRRRAADPTGVDLAMRMMGEQFVTGETIDEALERAARREARGLSLFVRHARRGGADRRRRRALSRAPTSTRSTRSARASRRAAASIDGPGHLDQAFGAASALRARAARARASTSSIRALRAARAAGARRTTSASTSTPRKPSGSSSRSTCSSGSAFEPALAGWNGIGFVVQAYQKRCPSVIDCARSTSRGAAAGA